MAPSIPTYMDNRFLLRLMFLVACVGEGLSVRLFFGRSSVRLITRMDAPGDLLTIVWFAFKNQVCCFR